MVASVVPMPNLHYFPDGTNELYYFRRMNIQLVGQKSTAEVMLKNSFIIDNIELV